MTNEIKIRVENQYGNMRNFPDCPLAHALIKLIGRKTFHEEELDILRGVGFVITVRSEAAEVEEGK